MGFLEFFAEAILHPVKLCEILRCETQPAKIHTT